MHGLVINIIKYQYHFLFTHTNSKLSQGFISNVSQSSREGKEECMEQKKMEKTLKEMEGSSGAHQCWKITSPNN